MVHATNPKEAESITDSVVGGMLFQLSKQAIFRGHVLSDKGMDLDGLIISYTKLPGNDVDKDAITLGWVTAAELKAVASS